MIRIIFASALVSSALFAQNAALMPVPRLGFFYDNASGQPLAGGFIYTCTDGSPCTSLHVGSPPTANGLATYTDKTASTPLPNPVVLDAAGQATIFLSTTASYTIVVQDRNGVIQSTTNGVSTFGGGSASNLIYNEGDTGAVNRTVTNKLQESVSAIDFGADPTGALGSAGAINKALAIDPTTRNGVRVFMPCGVYTLETTVTLSLPSQSLVGENQACVQFRYAGTGSGIIWQMNPFTTRPAGELGGFTLTCSGAAQNGILSGQIVGSYWHDIDVSGCDNVGAAAIRLHNRGNLATWTERNTFINVSTGGTGILRNTHGWLLDSDNSGDSFGYNRFLDIKINTSTDQDGFDLASGFFYNSILNVVCNSDNNVTGTTGAICLHSASNWDSNTLTLNGEWQNTGSGTGIAYSVQIEVGGRFSNLSGSKVSVFTSGGAQLGVNNLNAATATPDDTLVERSIITSWDTGTFTLNSVPTSPQPIQRANYGSMGMLLGTNIESPYVSMFQGTGNSFVVGTVATSNSIGQMVSDFTVDTFGVGTFFGKLLVCPDGRIAGGANCPGSIDGNAATEFGGYTSAHRAGLTDAYWLTTTGPNETMSGDVNFSGGWGFVEGVNIAHPMAWAYTIDPTDYELYEKTFQTQISGSPVFKVAHGGSPSFAGHLDQPSGSNNLAGTCSVSSGTSCTFTYTAAFNSTPICLISPNFDIGSTNRFWQSAVSSSSCSVTISASNSGSFSFIVIGNPN